MQWEERRSELHLMPRGRFQDVPDPGAGAWAKETTLTLYMFISLYKQLLQKIGAQEQVPWTGWTPGWAPGPEDRLRPPGPGHLDSTWGGVREGPRLNPHSLGNLRRVLLLYFYRNSADIAFSVSTEGLPTAPDGTECPPEPGSMSSQVAVTCNT